MNNSYRLGIDIGGTFTDAVLVSEETGEVQIAKVPSTPEDPSIGFLDALTRILEKAELEPESVAFLVHGTTVATNSLIEGKTPKTAFITTAGFGDMLEIARQVRPSLYDVHFEKPRPLVPRNLAYEVSERLDAQGSVLLALDPSSVERIAEELQNEEVASVAVCLLHSYSNAAHEQQVRDILLKQNPHLTVSLSSEFCRSFASTSVPAQPSSTPVCVPSSSPI